jgi:hypothetical protein
MSKHTPGPWRAFAHDWGIGVCSYCEVREYSGDICSAPEVGANSHRPREQDIANALLIAAAPDLLEALKETTMHLVAVHSLLKNGGNKAAASDAIFNLMLADAEKAFDRARAAIKKAEEVNS